MCDGIFNGQLAKEITKLGTSLGNMVKLFIYQAMLLLGVCFFWGGRGGGGGLSWFNSCLFFTVFLTDVCIVVLFFFFLLQGHAEGSLSQHADGTSAWQMKLPTAVPAMGHSV